jgi:hypothetical protein
LISPPRLVSTTVHYHGRAMKPTKNSKSQKRTGCQNLVGLEVADRTRCGLETAGSDENRHPERRSTHEFHLAPPLSRFKYP